MRRTKGSPILRMGGGILTLLIAAAFFAGCADNPDGSNPNPSPDPIAQGETFKEKLLAWEKGSGMQTYDIEGIGSVNVTFTVTFRKDATYTDDQTGETKTAKFLVISESTRGDTGEISIHHTPHNAPHFYPATFIIAENLDKDFNLKKYVPLLDPKDFIFSDHDGISGSADKYEAYRIEGDRLIHTVYSDDKDGNPKKESLELTKD